MGLHFIFLSAILVPLRLCRAVLFALSTVTSRRRADTQPSPGVVIAEELNDQALAVLNAGGKVLLLLPPSTTATF